MQINYIIWIFNSAKALKLSFMNFLTFEKKFVKCGRVNVNIIEWACQRVFKWCQI